ncbi:MAG: hypothetical protein MRY83_24760 [Flavobacteriales bacterium]|nr:hypothetical protein [Flavobacteriales bacterium]
MKYLLLGLSCFFMLQSKAQDSSENDEKPVIYFTRTSVTINPIFGKKENISSRYTNGFHSVNGILLTPKTGIGIGLAWEKSKLTHSFPMYLSLLQTIKTVKGVQLQASLNYGYAAAKQVEFGEFSKYSFKPGNPLFYAGIIGIPATGNQHNVFFEVAYRFSNHPIEKNNELVSEKWHGVQLMVGYAFN